MLRICRNAKAGFRIVAALALIACGDNAAEKANREALVPIVHRNRSLSDEYARWVQNNELASSVSYGEVLSQYEKFKTAKESLRTEIRRIVPTPEYDCLISLLARSVEADVAVIGSRASMHQHALAYSGAANLAKNYIASAKSSGDGSRVYLQSAHEQVASMEAELQQMNDFSKASNKGALFASALADSLVSAVLQYKLLPNMERPRYPISTDSGTDSFTHSAATAVAACKK